MIVHTVRDVHYLPAPNIVEVVLSDELAPTGLTRTAFMVPVCEDGSVVLAVNQRRGIEMPGGHIDGEETAEIAAIRECFEETGAVVRDVRPLGYLRMTSAGEAPDGWLYPHPLSYQQFFAGAVVRIEDYSENDECAAPVMINDLGDPRITRDTIRIFGEAARAGMTVT